MRFSRKISPDTKPKQNFVTKKRLREDEINFDKLRSYRLDRVKKELEKNNLEACILFDPVNVRYALDTVNMSVYNMHNLTRCCFIPVNGPAITSLNKSGIEVVDAKSIIEQARVIKSPEELKCMKAAIDVAEIAVNKMRNELKAGMTEDELWSILHKTNIENGGEWVECRILSSGERTNPWMQESSNKIIQSGEMVSFDTDMVGPYGYCADISRAFVEGHKFSEEQKKLYLMGVEHINHNSRLIKPGVSFKEFTDKSWKLPEEYYGNRYSCMVHGIGLCDEWPQIKYPTDGGQREGYFEKNMTITVETYIGKVGGKEGVKLEQQYLVGENGLELMSHHPLEDL